MHQICFPTNIAARPHRRCFLWKFGARRWHLSTKKAHSVEEWACKCLSGKGKLSGRGYSFCRYLQTIISRIILSVVCIPSAPMRPRLQMVFSMQSSMIPSFDEMQILSRANTAACIEDDTPDATLRAHPTFAPSQTIPVMFPIIFLIAEHTCS